MPEPVEPTMKTLAEDLKAMVDKRKANRERIDELKGFLVDLRSNAEASKKMIETFIGTNINVAHRAALKTQLTALTADSSEDAIKQFTENCTKALVAPAAVLPPEDNSEKAKKAVSDAKKAMALLLASPSVPTNDEVEAAIEKVRQEIRKLPSAAIPAASSAATSIPSDFSTELSELTNVEEITKKALAVRINAKAAEDAAENKTRNGRTITGPQSISPSYNPDTTSDHRPLANKQIYTWNMMGDQGTQGTIDPASNKWLRHPNNGFNHQETEPEYTERKTRLMDVIETMASTPAGDSLIHLQEFPNDGAFLNTLQSQLPAGWKVEFQAFPDAASGKKNPIGVATIYNGNMLEARNVTPEAPITEQKGRFLAIEFTQKNPGAIPSLPDSFTDINIHQKYIKNAAGELDIKEMEKAIKTFSAHYKDKPLLIVGDLNMDARKDAYKALPENSGYHLVCGDSTNIKAMPGSAKPVEESLDAIIYNPAYVSAVATQQKKYADKAVMEAHDALGVEMPPPPLPPKRKPADPRIEKAIQDALQEATKARKAATAANDQAIAARAAADAAKKDAAKPAAVTSPPAISPDAATLIAAAEANAAEAEKNARAAASAAEAADLKVNDLLEKSAPKVEPAEKEEPKDDNRIAKIIKEKDLVLANLNKLLGEVIADKSKAEDSLKKLIEESQRAINELDKLAKAPAAPAADPATASTTPSADLAAIETARKAALADITKASGDLSDALNAQVKVNKAEEAAAKPGAPANPDLDKLRTKAAVMLGDATTTIAAKLDPVLEKIHADRNKALASFKFILKSARIFHTTTDEQIKELDQKHLRVTEKLEAQKAAATPAQIVGIDTAIEEINKAYGLVSSGLKKQQEAKKARDHADNLSSPANISLGTQVATSLGYAGTLSGPQALAAAGLTAAASVVVPPVAILVAASAFLAASAAAVTIGIMSFRAEKKANTSAAIADAAMIEANEALNKLSKPVSLFNPDSFIPKVIDEDKKQSIIDNVKTIIARPLQQFDYSKKERPYLATYSAQINYLHRRAKQARHDTSLGNKEVEYVVKQCKELQEQLALYYHASKNDDKEANNIVKAKVHLQSLHEIIEKYSEKMKKEMKTYKSISDKSIVVDTDKAQDSLAKLLASTNIDCALTTKVADTKPTIFSPHENKTKLNVTSFKTTERIPWKLLPVNTSVNIVSVQQRVNGVGFTKLQFSKENIKNFTEKDYIRWAYTEVENHHGVYGNKKIYINDNGKMPKQLIEAMIKYCTLKGYPYQNDTKHTYIPSDKDIDKLKDHFRKNSDSIPAKVKEATHGVKRLTQEILDSPPRPGK